MIVWNQPVDTWLMTLFPPSTNRDYRGAKIAPWFLILAGLLELGPGCIHYFLPDGGAGVIAGLDLTHNRSVILGMFAWTGSVQIPFGLVMILVALRYQSFVPLFLLLDFIERALMSLSSWVLKPAPGPHFPPEHYGSPIAALLLAIFFVLSLRSRASSA
jgi:hypothetical protein